MAVDMMRGTMIEDLHQLEVPGETPHTNHEVEIERGKILMELTTTLILDMEAARTRRTRMDNGMMRWHHDLITLLDASSEVPATMSLLLPGQETPILPRTAFLLPDLPMCVLGRR